MPFDWMTPSRNSALDDRHTDAARQMFRDEIRARAGLLRRLGWGREQVLARCLRTHAWEVDLLAHAGMDQDEITGLVNEVFGA